MAHLIGSGRRNHGLREQSARTAKANALARTPVIMVESLQVIETINIALDGCCRLEPAQANLEFGMVNGLRYVRFSSPKFVTSDRKQPFNLQSLNEVKLANDQTFQSWAEDWGIDSQKLASLVFKKMKRVTWPT